MGYGDQRRLFQEVELFFQGTALVGHRHNNGIVVIRNTKHNCEAILTIPVHEIEKKYTVVERTEEPPQEDASGKYLKYVMILKEKKSAK
ncbi:hypothetical protein NECID01_2104 [Nematocida sp. AWRm77]|nr:hypothetical protein NECID01_2104 [Nematocida sp. AWRm77]